MKKLSEYSILESNYNSSISGNDSKYVLFSDKLVAKKSTSNYPELNPDWICWWTESQVEEGLPTSDFSEEVQEKIRATRPGEVRMIEGDDETFYCAHLR